MNVYFVIYFVYGNNRIMECDRICIYRIYRNFGIVIEQCTDDQFSIDQFSHTRILAYPFVHWYIVANIYILIRKNKNFDISNIFHNLPGNTEIRFFNIFSIFAWFWIVYLAYIYVWFNYDYWDFVSRNVSTLRYALRVRQFPSVLLSSLRSSPVTETAPFPSWIVGDKSTRGRKINQTNSDYRMKSFQITKSGHFNSFITTTVNPMSCIVFFHFTKCIQRFSVISSHVYFYKFARGR